APFEEVIGRKVSALTLWMLQECSTMRAGPSRALCPSSLRWCDNINHHSDIRDNPDRTRRTRRLEGPLARGAVIRLEERDYRLRSSQKDWLSLARRFRASARVRRKAGPASSSRGRRRVMVREPRV